MDKQILQKLYKDYGNEILLYLYSLCGSRDMAEDLMQETFEKALLSLADRHTNVRAWLYLVARNLCFNAMKKEKRQISMEEFRLQGIQGNEKQGWKSSRAFQKKRYPGRADSKRTEPYIVSGFDAAEFS